MKSCETCREQLASGSAPQAKDPESVVFENRSEPGLGQIPVDPEVHVLFKQGRIRRLPENLDARNSDAYLRIKVAQAKTELKKVEGDLKIRLLLTRGLMGGAFLVICIVALTVLLVGLGRIRLPPEVFFLGLGLLGPTISKGALAYRPLRTYLLGEADRESDKLR